jgi:hypothetical protein
MWNMMLGGARGIDSGVDMTKPARHQVADARDTTTVIRPVHSP